MVLSDKIKTEQICKQLFKLFRVVCLLQRIYSITIIAHSLESYFLFKWTIRGVFAYRIISDVYFIRSMLANTSRIWERSENRIVECLMIYYSTQQSLPHYLICVYTFDIANAICSTAQRTYSVSKQMNSTRQGIHSTRQDKSQILQSQSNLIRFIIISSTIDLLLILIQNEYIIGYFSSHNKFEELPNLLNLLSTNWFIKYYNSDDVTNEFQMKISNNLGILFLMYYFYQYKLNLILAYIFLKLVQYLLAYLTTLKLLVSNVLTQKQLLNLILQQYNSIHHNRLPTLNFYIQYLPGFEFDNNNNNNNINNNSTNNDNSTINDDDMIQFLSMLGYCQANMNYVFIKIGDRNKIQLQLPQKTDFDLTFENKCSQAKMIDYLCNTEYLIELKDGIYTKFKILKIIIEIISQIRLINYPQSKPILKKQCNQNQDILKIIVFHKNIKDLMLFSSQQIIYDLYSNY